MIAARRALLSVSDKRGIVPFARALHAAGFELVSTGGTFRTLRDAGVEVRYVTEITGHPEVFDGRVKTLHPRVHGGILYRRDIETHVDQANDHDIAPIDIVAVNLYPFRQTVAAEHVTEVDAIEQIDIGGPAMVRAAAKNFASVTVVVSPDDYDGVAAELAANGSTSLETRRALALAAFRHTADYDTAIATWLARDEGSLPSALGMQLAKVDDLRYGENPHQAAALYAPNAAPPLGGATSFQGKALSYNNLVDLDAAVACVAEFDEPAAVVVKHTNPCGVGRHSDSALEAWRLALAGDPVSAFGGIVALNRTVDLALARELADIFLEVVAAPGFDADALELLSAKKALRVLSVPLGLAADVPQLRHTLFGFVAQTPDPRIRDAAERWDVVTARAPSPDEAAALRFLWPVCKHVKSNAIVVGAADRTFGVGAGQTSRVDAARLATQKATGPLSGAAAASDAFFPFRDGLDVLADAGITAVVQPGGSKRDDEVIAACNERGVAMVFTGHRHFRH
ncbi:MAG: bifunctional phosphoribosylaminoimidazolecarboxamide formyltransferase/IMP cyclohydrolase [Myxococcales bacterium]|nr:bifunctional phosphoribosylaminoimidazolecarboxamide formyltransferase/IMP cyclohydrolase [Myxococcales bacterium]MCB9530748.1 bifunctional phosphoribosylaminoimidazolecarboxamide formyltransferase/IMP cyclohydrolase [Myxococcales bacterium]